METTRSECDKARREVEASDAEISGMEQEEERLKLQYVESARSGLKGTCSFAVGCAARLGAFPPLSPRHSKRAVGPNPGHKWAS